VKARGCGADAGAAAWTGVAQRWVIAVKTEIQLSNILNRINYFGVTHLINWIIDLFNRDRTE
jgi:hypothetical protein